MSSNTERFTDKATDYDVYRPQYPEEMFEHIVKVSEMDNSERIADIGSGTGISSQYFLENGYLVFAVEPNEAMRTIAEEKLSSFYNFRSIDGTGESTTLGLSSVDRIIMGQAFHWIDAKKTRYELRNILSIRNTPNVFLFWNTRDRDANDFMREHEQMHMDLANDYRNVAHTNKGDEGIKIFFDDKYEEKQFGNKQIFDKKGFVGRVLSSSYTPKEGEKNYEEFIRRTKDLFDKYNTNGKVEIPYITQLFYGNV